MTKREREWVTRRGIVLSDLVRIRIAHRCIGTLTTYGSERREKVKEALDELEAEVEGELQTLNRTLGL